MADTTARCVNGHVLYIQVTVSESITHWSQGDDCALVVFRDEAYSVKPERSEWVGCSEGCEVSSDALSTLRFRLRNSERRT